MGNKSKPATDRGEDLRRHLLESLNREPPFAPTIADLVLVAHALDQSERAAVIESLRGLGPVPHSQQVVVALCSRRVSDLAFRRATRVVDNFPGRRAAWAGLARLARLEKLLEECRQQLPSPSDDQDHREWSRGADALQTIDKLWAAATDARTLNRPAIDALIATVESGARLVEAGHSVTVAATAAETIGQLQGSGFIELALQVAHAQRPLFEQTIAAWANKKPGRTGERSKDTLFADLARALGLEPSAPKSIKRRRTGGSKKRRN